MLKHIVLVTGKVPEKLTKLEEECKRKEVCFWYELPEEDTLIKETLYITDHEEICNQLLEEQANVLVWLHDENKGQNLSKAPYAIEELKEADYLYLERIYDRFMGNPWLIAKTQRCRIREMKEEDLDAVYEIYEHPSITRYMEGLYEDREQELEYIRSYIQNAYKFWGYGTWIIERKEDRKIIGRAGFNLREGFEKPELGFVIGKQYQRQGYAYEVCKTLLEIGKNDYEFEAVQILVKKENQPSVSLCKKLGFEFVNKVMEQGEEYLYYIYQY